MSREFNDGEGWGLQEEAGAFRECWDFKEETLVGNENLKEERELKQ